jgi:hypothetical protein
MRNDRRSFDLKLCGGLNEARDLYGGHRWKMRAEHHAIGRAERLLISEVFIDID